MEKKKKPIIPFFMARRKRKWRNINFGIFDRTKLLFAVEEMDNNNSINTMVDAHVCERAIVRAADDND